MLILRIRICPGRDLANEIVPAMIMTLLWAFEIAPIDGEAQPDRKNPQFVDAIIGYVRIYMSRVLPTNLV
jgi:hypothetical protein